MAKRKRSANGWLFKQEPSCYSFADLERDDTTWWDGVNNALARQHLRAVTVGDRVLYYHTGSEKAIIGEMLVVAGPQSDPNCDDPKSVVVQVKVVRRWDQPITLARIKTDPVFADWELLRISRLSVMPVSAELWERLAQMEVESVG
ncbi:MAG: EVE domain-containing protein [Gemmataceae bacterium]|nr:EVE domain-containing protein [Gemmataceae bacterium]